MAVLVRKGVHRTPWVIWLPSSEELMLGKKYFPALREGVNVSPKHAVLCSNNKGSWFIKDTSTTYGVFVNSTKIPKGGICEIHNEDSIGLGVSEGTQEEEFEFIFYVNLSRKVHGQLNPRYAHGEQRYLPVSPKECDDENCRTMNNENSSDCSSDRDIVIVEEFSSSHVSSIGPSSDAVSNSRSGGCRHAVEGDSEMVPQEVTNTNHLSSLLSSILTSVTGATDRIEETTRQNEMECRELNTSVINGSKEAIPENVSTNLTPTPHHHHGSCIPEKDGNRTVVVNNIASEEVVKNGENVQNESNLNSMDDLNGDSGQKLQDSKNLERNGGADSPHSRTSDSVSTSGPVLSPNRKTAKKKNASKPRKRCRLFTRKKKQKKKTASPGKCKQLQENETFEEKMLKKYEIEGCYVALQTLNVDLVNGHYAIPKNSVDSGRSVQLEQSAKQFKSLKRTGVGETSDSAEKPKPGKTTNQNRKPKTSTVHRINGENRKMMFPDGKYTKLLRNYILLKRLENIPFQSSNSWKKKHINSQISANDNTTVTKSSTIDGSSQGVVYPDEINNETTRANNKKIPRQANTITKTNNSVIKTKEVPNRIPNGISKKAASKSPLVKNNQEVSKSSNNITGSLSSNKKLVTSKKKTVNSVNPCQNNGEGTNDSSQKHGEQKAVNHKISENRANVMSGLSFNYTIPKRKKSDDDDNLEVKRVCTTYDTDRSHQEKSASSKSAYGNKFKRGGAARRLSEGDTRGGIKRNNDFSSSNFPDKRSVARREFESHRSPNSFVCTSSPYGNTSLLDNVHHESRYLTSPSDSFSQSPMSREENVVSFMQMNQINRLANTDHSVMRYSSITSPPIHNSNIPFVPQYPDQMQSKVNVLDPRVFRMERSSSLPSYNGIGFNSYQMQKVQVQDMEICELDSSNYFVDCAQSYNSNSMINDNRYLLPSDQNVACSVGAAMPVGSNCDISNMGCVQDPTPVTPEFPEKNSSTDYSISVPFRIPSPPVLSELITTSFSLESVLQQILSWNVNWLQEQRTSSRPPPVTIGTVKKLQLSYFTFDDYILSFLQLILLEIWQLLFSSWSQKNDEVLNFIITNSSEENGSIVLACQTVTTSIEAPNFPKEGKLLTFELMSKAGKVSKIFGYILKHSVEKKASTDISEELMRFHHAPASVSVCLLLVNFTVKIKKKEVNLFRDKLVKAHVIYYLKHHLHVIKCLLELPKSPLVKLILTPKKACCVVPAVAKKNQTIKGSYSAMQQALILGICQAVMTKDQTSRIIAVHGAPGTGKTHIILGILQQLLHLNGKILVTATSDAALNEIGMRMKSLLKSSHLPDSKFILVGSPDKFPRDLLPFTLREMVKSVMDTCRQKVRLWEELEKDIQLEIEAFRQSISDMQERSCPPEEISRTEKDLLGKLKQQTENRERLKNAQAKLRDCAKNEKSSLRMQFLLNANVILSTLNNCRHILLENSLMEEYSFSCCIIDEATQSVEPELLQPLVFGMDKLILFGDKDLPPVIYSKASLDYNYELSLSGRIDSYFTETGEGSPIVKLTEQYRMDPEICMFPSRFLYANTITSVPQIKTSDFAMVPYIALNSAKLSETFKKSGSPTLEEILVKLCKEIVRLIGSKYSIGIILPSNDQLKSVCKVLVRHLECKNIETNVVDFFQGQEKDVIILPCSTSNGENCSKGYLAHKHKLAIALTRAKRSLIVLGNFKTMVLESNMDQLLRDAKDRGLCLDLDTADNFSECLRLKNSSFRQPE